MKGLDQSDCPRKGMAYRRGEDMQAGKKYLGTCVPTIAPKQSTVAPGPKITVQKFPQKNNAWVPQIYDVRMYCMYVLTS